MMAEMDQMRGLAPGLAWLLSLLLAATAGSRPGDVTGAGTDVKGADTDVTGGHTVWEAGGCTLIGAVLWTVG